MVYYRKYRPQKIGELDSNEIRTKLTSVLSKSAPTFITVPHAFLFTGPKGLGKTSTARIVAKVINCTGRKDTSGKDIEPCNSCEQCTSITNGTNMDILEIDAASNRGIDEMRDLKEKIRLAPLKAKKKIYIIDEVHMLTTEAFNALLKTLEEPPEHAVFMLCTTEVHKIPPTILSRCFHIGFTLATDDELVRAFQRVTEGEGIEVEEKILKKIARLADGGFRDGTKILEELVALSGGNTIDEAFLEGKFHVESIDQSKKKLLATLEEKDVKSALSVIAQTISQGIDSKFFLSSFIEYLHELLLVKVGVEGSNAKTALSLSDLRTLLSLMTEAMSDSKSAVVPSLPLELAVITWCEGSIPTQVTSVQKEVVTVVTQTNEEVSVNTLRKQLGNMAKERAVSGEVKETKEEAVKRDPADVSILKFSATGDVSEEWVETLWKNIIAEMKSHNHMIAGVLRSCRIIGYDRKVLTILAASTFHKERLEEAKTFKVLGDVCAELIGNPVSISIQLK